MSNWSAVVTNGGRTLLASWITGTTFNFDGARGGTGTVSVETLPSQTALASQQQVLSLLGYESVAGGVKLKIQVRAPAAAYTLNQIGVWGSIDGGASVMIAIFQNADGISIPSSTLTPDFIYNFFAVIEMSNTGTFTLTIDTSAVISRSEFETELAGKLDTAGDGSDVTVAFGQAVVRESITTGDTLSVLMGKIAKWFASLGTAAFKSVPIAGNAGADEVVIGSDARLSDSRTPTSHSHSINDVAFLADGLNGKLDTAGDGSDVTATFVRAESRVNLVSGEKLSVALGKLSKWFSSFGGAAWLDVGAASAKVAAGIHATQHASGGADAITPVAIGAATDNHAHGSITSAGKIGDTADLPIFTLDGGSVGTKGKAGAKIALDIAPNGFEYSGREIPLTWAQIQAKVAVGDFSGLRVGDYKDIVLSGSFYDAAESASKTITDAVFRMEIAGIDSYYRYGSSDVPHHIDFISRDCLAPELQYNASATNSGSFIGSALFTTLNGTNGLRRLLPSDVTAVIKNKQGMTEVKTGTNASTWAWNDMGKLWLPTEQEIWGHATWAEHKFGGGLSVQYPIFRDGLRHIIKGNGNGGPKCYWWNASSEEDSAANFCLVGYAGFPHSAAADSVAPRVPLCFRVA